MKKCLLILLCVAATLVLLWLFGEKSSAPAPRPETTWESEFPTDPDTDGEETADAIETNPAADQP